MTEKRSKKEEQKGVFAIWKWLTGATKSPTTFEVILHIITANYHIKDSNKILEEMDKAHDRYVKRMIELYGRFPL